MLLRRLKSDFHKAINYLTAQTVVFRHSQSYVQTHGKDSDPHLELLKEFRWELHVGSCGGTQNHVLKLTLERGLSGQ